MQANVKAPRTNKAKAKAAESAVTFLPLAIIPGAETASTLPANESAQATIEPVAIAYKTATRDAATVTAQATHFAQYSDRDTAYLVFFGLAMRPHNDSATLAQIHACGKPDATGNRRSNPFYIGSAKATDAGAINRLIKAGYFIASDSGNRLSATAKAIESKAYQSQPIAPAESV